MAAKSGFFSTVVFLVLYIALLNSIPVFGVGMNCPKSQSWQHAGCETMISFQSSCSAVRDEITARVGGQYESWYDPHNNGTYTFVSKNDPALFQLSRLTGDKKYTDLINFSFEDAGSGCNVSACSESQSFSVGDYGTNYCNIFDLYCSDAKCKPFSALKYSEKVGKCTEVSPSKCFVK